MLAAMSPHTSGPVRARDRFRYWFDNVMARGTIAVMMLLALATVVFIAVIALLVVVFGLFPAGDDDGATFFEVLWGNLMRTLDPGNMADDAGWGFRAAMLVVTVGGLIVVASLIGIISSAFDLKVEELRKGRSRVLESDHTLILGWSPKVLTIVAELCLANESRRRPVIVILADRDKVELEEELRALMPRHTSTRVVVRSGDPMDLADLELVAPYAARSVILVAPEGSRDPDAAVIKTALALTNNPRRPHGPLNIVGELQDSRNLEAATLVGRDEVSWVTRDVISRITVQACRQNGLSGVYAELLGFDGGELYVASRPELDGRTFIEAQLSFADSSLLGLVREGAVMLNPPAETLLGADDELIVLAEDDSTVRLGAPGVPDAAPIVAARSRDDERRSERTLILGCNADLEMIVRELDQYVAPGSEALIVADAELTPTAGLENLGIEYRRSDVTSRAVLEALDAPSFDHIVVLADRELDDAQRADAKTLVTLLHLREIGDRAGVDLSIVSEMLDDRNREIAEVTRAQDFIVSDKLISLTLSQLSENRVLERVFDALLSSEGSEIYLKPASRYVRVGEPVDFYTVVDAARRRGETAIGFRESAAEHDPARHYGVRLNPLKSQRVVFAERDSIIVLAED